MCCCLMNQVRNHYEIVWERNLLYWEWISWRHNARQFLQGVRHVSIAIPQIIYTTNLYYYAHFHSANHLDLPAILWLQSYLKTLTDTTLLVVSHDRRFLNATVEEIIRFRDQKLTYHVGDYDEFEENTKNERLKKERMYEAQEKQKKHMEESIQKAQKKAKESGDDKKLGMVASRKKVLGTGRQV